MFLPTAHVTVFRGTRPVARTSVPSGGTYRVTLAPGTYEITNTGEPGGPDSRTTVTAGRTTHFDVPDGCM